MMGDLLKMGLLLRFLLIFGSNSTIGELFFIIVLIEFTRLLWFILGWIGGFAVVTVGILTLFWAWISLLIRAISVETSDVAGVVGEVPVVRTWIKRSGLVRERVLMFWTLIIGGRLAVLIVSLVIIDSRFGRKIGMARRVFLWGFRISFDFFVLVVVVLRIMCFWIVFIVLRWSIGRFGWIIMFKCCIIRGWVEFGSVMRVLIVVIIGFLLGFVRKWWVVLKITHKDLIKNIY